MKSSTKGLITAIVIAAVIIGAFAVSFSDITTTATFWSLVPPVVAIALALITKEVYSSLFIGVLVGAIFAADGSITKTVDLTVNDGLISAISGTAGIFLFLVLLGAIVALINRAGGSAAFGRWAKVHIKTRIGAQLATFVLGVLIFIDDYFNCLTVGSVMMPVTDSHKISRAKFSYLIDATAAPICMIAPVSSWAAAVSSTAADLNAGISGIELFIRAIPFNFYSLLTLVFIVTLVLLKVDYGPMAKHEKNAIENGDLFSTDERVDGEAYEANEKGKVLDLILPIVALVIVCILGLLYVGGFFGVDIWGGTENKGNLIGAFGNTDATVGLPWGSLIAFILIVIYMVARKLVSFNGAMESIPQGFKAMVPAITILTLATSLKNVTGLLDSDTFIDTLMKSDAAQSLAWALPAVIFIVACLLAFATGTSWGTFGILIPIVVTMFPDVKDPLLFIGISACLAGAVCGDHCSPISDTTIMSSAGARCVHVNHVSTQLPYAITVAVISFVMFLLAGFLGGLLKLGFTVTAVLSLAIGVVVTVGFLFVMKNLQAKKNA
ncbi:MAG: Na+/H+ antiporter NhaC family protein [Clostridia bacterium]|nr:Na+/H+ antiporter NhaC family protein [Clostridia bacterium]